MTADRGLLRLAGRAVLAGLVAGGVVLAFTVEEGTWDRLGRLAPPVIVACFGLVVTAWLANGARTWVLARALGHRLELRQSVGVTLSSELGIAATPAGLGGPALRVALLGRYRVPVAHASALVAADAALDALFFLLLLPFAAVRVHATGLLEALEPAEGRLQLFAAIVGAVLVAVVALGIFVRAFRRRLPVPWRLGLWRLGRRVRRTVRRSLAALRRLVRSHPLSLAVAFALAVVQWSCRYGVLPLLLWDLGSPLDPLLLVYLQGLLFTGSLLVALPGGGGSVELAAAFVFGLLIPKALVGPVVLLWRLFTYHLYLLAGGVAFAGFVLRSGTAAEPIGERAAQRPSPTPSPSSSPGTGKPRSRMRASISASRPRKAR